MEPGPDRPGITYCTPQDPRTLRQPEAAYWCRCGDNARATGTHQVLALIDQWADHCEACPLAPEPRRRRTGGRGRAASVLPVDRRREGESAARDGLWAA